MVSCPEKLGSQPNTTRYVLQLPWQVPTHTSACGRILQLLAYHDIPDTSIERQVPVSRYFHTPDYRKV